MDVHWKDGLRSARDGSLDLAWVHGPALRVYIHKHRASACIIHRGDGGNEGKRYCNHFIGRTHPGCEQRKMQRAGAGIHSNSVLYFSAIGCKLSFECLHLLSEDELATFQHSANGNLDFLPDRLVLGIEIEEWH